MTVSEQVAVVNNGIGNTGSLTRALRRLGADVRLVTSPDEVSDTTRLVLPGVGSFSSTMRVLETQGWVEALLAYAASGRPIMGICLGMQLLMEVGEEGGFTPGLGLIAGTVGPLPAGEGLKLPHMGWNSIEPVTDHAILSSVRSGVDYYFAHSYAVSVQDLDTVVAETHYGRRFPSVIATKNVLGLQFHPEKSPPMGLRVLRNFLEWAPQC